MELLKTRLSEPDIRGIVRSAQGEIVEFHNQGVSDLFNLLTEHPEILDGGMIADRVIGRGAAFMLIKGRIKSVFAYVISLPALSLLQDNGIEVSYSTLQPNIINRTKDGICPVELLTSGTDSPDEAIDIIRVFLNKTRT